jgi:hypothetical protein
VVEVWRSRSRPDEDVEEEKGVRGTSFEASAESHLTARATDLWTREKRCLPRTRVALALEWLVAKWDSEVSAARQEAD